jgi:hypothetical protein
MAAINTTNPTIVDLSKSLDPNGSSADIVELLAQDNEILADMTWIEGNLDTGHRTTSRTGLPSATWRRMYKGVQPSKSTVVQTTDSCGMLEAYSVIDKALADLNGRKASFMLQESASFLEAMNQEIADTIFYGNEKVSLEKFTGLTPRFNNRSTSVSETANNVLHGGGAGTDNASIWLCVWGPRTGFGIVPKGSKTGFQMDDRGQQTQTESDGSKWESYVTHFRWDAGMCVRDWRYFFRICNIDKSLLTADLSTGANLHDLMFQAMEGVKDLNAGRPVFYMSRKLRTILRQQASNGVKNSTLNVENVGGTILYDFHGIPIRIVDRLAGDEALVPSG